MDRRRVFAWGRIPAGAGRRASSGTAVRGGATVDCEHSRPQGAFGVYPLSEQLNIFAASPGQSDSHAHPPALRELRIPRGAPAPLPGPWTLSAVVSGRSPA